jgi:hypothetical protein
MGVQRVVPGVTTQSMQEDKRFYSRVSVIPAVGAERLAPDLSQLRASRNGH